MRPTTSTRNCGKANSRWSQPGSNRRPFGCKPNALPTELWPQAPDSRTVRRSHGHCGRIGPDLFRRNGMAENETAVAVGEREDPDKSAEATEAESDKVERARPAEVSNLDIVRHYFDIAADRLKLADD